MRALPRGVARAIVDGTCATSRASGRWWSRIPVNRVLPHAVIYFEPVMDADRPAARCSSRSPQGEPHIYVQQGPHQGGYADEIAIDPINLQPGDDAVIVTRLREELGRR